MEIPDIQILIQSTIPQIAGRLFSKSLKDSELDFTPQSHGEEAREKYGVKGAKEMALEGYKLLFEDWLPFYRSLEGEEFRIQKTLLRIMSTLDDTCVIHRVGYDRAQGVKTKAAALLGEIPGLARNDGQRIARSEGQEMARNEGLEEVLKPLCAQYALEGISPGGAADMLALTVFIESVLN